MQLLRSPGRPHRGGDIINKMNGIGQAAVERGQGRTLPGWGRSRCKGVEMSARCWHSAHHPVSTNVQHYCSGMLDLSL